MGKLGWSCPGVGITFRTLSQAVGPGGDVAPHQWVGAQSSLFDALQSGGGFAQSGDPDRVQQHYDCSLHQRERHSLSGIEPRINDLVQVGDSEEHPAASGSSTGSGQHAGLSCGGPHGVQPGREVGETSFSDGQAAEDLFASASNTHFPLWYIQSGLSSGDYCSKCIITTVDRAVSVCFFSISAVGQNPGQDTGGQGRGGDRHSPHVAEEVLVHPATADGM